MLEVVTLKTEIAVVLDQSGSMASIKSDAIGGFNSFIEAQKAVPGEATLSLTLFDSTVSYPLDGVPLDEVQPLNGHTYRPRGMTALYDAIGNTVNRIGAKLAALPESERPDKVIIAILTDGAENASREFSHAHIREMIEHQESKYSWEFIFLAANQDAMAVGGAMGIKSANAVNFEATGLGITRGYADLSMLVTGYRVDGSNKHDA